MLVGKQALSDLEMTEESVHRILRVLFPSNPSSMARVGSSYRRERPKVLAFQNPSHSVPNFPVERNASSPAAPPLQRSFSSNLKMVKPEKSVPLSAERGLSGSRSLGHQKI